MTHRKTSIRQRAELTFRSNYNLGRHGWLRLTPAYSVRLVEGIIVRPESGSRVLDPFSGTGTTILCAATHEKHALGLDINPFLVWFGKAKIDFYPDEIIHETSRLGKAACRRTTLRDPEVDSLPPIHNIERWWGREEIAFLSSLKAAIDDECPRPSQVRTLLYVSFCRTLIALSNAAFNHQSMSFKEKTQRINGLFGKTTDFDSVFNQNLQTVLQTASMNPVGSADVRLMDSRNLDELKSQFDLVVTSPPYPNRMSYIRELRPYMYWLGYLANGKDAGELDWKAIGGTWGIATSRLAQFDRSTDGYYPGYFNRILTDIAHADNKSGILMSNYVAKYFEDMQKHFIRLVSILCSGATIHYVVGNSTFYGVLVPVERLYKELMEYVGFRDVKIVTLRKRNSKKELLEFDVSGRL